METYYISRDGIKDYQRNHRPLLGEGIRTVTNSIGTAMLDSTICDIYLVNNRQELIGRPLMTAYLNSRTDNNPSLFVSIKKPYNRLTKEGIESIVKRIGKKAKSC